MSAYPIYMSGISSKNLYILRDAKELVEFFEHEPRFIFFKKTCGREKFMPNASQGGFVFHTEREPTHYAFVHIERAGPAGRELTDCVSQYAIWHLPKGSYKGPFEKNSKLCEEFNNNPEYRKVAVIISAG